MTSVIIVSDIRIYREGLKNILAHEGSLKVVMAVSGIEQAIATIQERTPDIVLLDMTMLSSCEAVRRIVSSAPESRVIVLAIAEDEEHIFHCAKAGVSGYVLREASIEQLIQTISRVSKGNIYCPEEIVTNLLTKIKSMPDYEETAEQEALRSGQNNTTLSDLTMRERQVVKLVFNGLSNKQIARDLNIELSTVKNHIHNILRKLKLSSRLQLVSHIHQNLLSV